LLSDANEIATVYGATFDLLHVVDEVPRPTFCENAGFTLERTTSNTEYRARREMRHLFESAPGPCAAVRYHGTSERASQEIIHFAKNIDADLIVIAAQGLSGNRSLLLGSVAERVVRTAPCPVVTVKP
jgi:nucleotide-binding universal stress UspA family protein